MLSRTTFLVWLLINKEELFKLWVTALTKQMEKSSNLSWTNYQLRSAESWNSMWKSVFNRTIRGKTERLQMHKGDRNKKKWNCQASNPFHQALLNTNKQCNTHHNSHTCHNKWTSHLNRWECHKVFPTNKQLHMAMHPCKGRLPLLLTLTLRWVKETSIIMTAVQALAVTVNPMTMPRLLTKEPEVEHQVLLELLECQLCGSNSTATARTKETLVDFR